MYAILDIETTGGQYNEEGITEIAIYKFDGHEIVDQFISLVNPEIPIQPFVIKLTGINNEMLTAAPKFFEIAKRIIEITDGCVIVAHNAVFDYRILRTEFRRLGYTFEAKSLCTVELAKVLMPEQESHSLGKLVRALGIPMADRHRASGDAMATVKLFKMLLDKDLKKTIVKSLIQTEIVKGLEPRLLDIVESLPSRTGVYYIHREDGKIIYIGKSNNIRKRVNQHFTGTAEKCKKIQNEVFTVTFEETGSELVALLKESEEIKINLPVYNRARKKNIFPWALYAESDNRGYLGLKLRQIDTRKHEIMSFASYAEAKGFLFKITSEYRLCPKLNALQDVKEQCFEYALGNCDGACIRDMSADDYNIRVQQFIDAHYFEEKTIVVIERGRKSSEKSAVLIENGIYKGYAFFDLNYQIRDIDILKNILVAMPDHRDSRMIIQNHIRKSRFVKVLEF